MRVSREPTTTAAAWCMAVASAVVETVDPFPPTPRRDWIAAPGSAVAQSGIYDVVDEHGRYLSYQRAVVASPGDQAATFPELDDPEAAGYVLRLAPVHDAEHLDLYRPGQRVPWDGIYDVVDERGHYLGRQKVCVHHTVFPPLKHTSLPQAHGYLLRERALQRTDR